MTAVEELAERVKALSVGDKLRLAAGLADRGKYDMAEMVAAVVTTELTALRLFGKASKKTGASE